MSYAVLWVRDFALCAVRRSDPTLAGRPVALIQGEGRRATVVELSPEVVGVAPGLTAPLAMARCPGILLRLREPAAEGEANRLLLAAAFTLSPRVEFTGPGCVTVDLQGADAARTAAQMRNVVAELAPAGLPVRIGVGATPHLAACVARRAEPVLAVRDAGAFLHALPLAFADPTPEQVEILGNWGIRTLGELTALPKADIGKRLGPEGLQLWERAAGEATRPLRLTQPAKSFAAEWTYEPPIEVMEPLLFRLRRFSECIALELRGEGFVAETLTLTLLLEDGTDQRREFRLPEPGGDVDGWMRVMQSHLEGVRTAVRVAGARLIAGPCRPPHKQAGLFETGLGDPAAFWENLARVGAVVGAHRLGTPVLLDTHRPDAFRLEKPAETVPPPAAAPVHPPRGLVLRRFRPAWPAQVELRDERPVQVHSANLRGPVCTSSGPWRTSGEWWKPDGWVLEIWQVELAQGGVYQLAHWADGWCVEGEFD